MMHFRHLLGLGLIQYAAEGLFHLVYTDIVYTVLRLVVCSALWFVSFFVLAVMPVTFAKLLATSPLASTSTLYRTRPHVYQHIASSQACSESCSMECFTILDTAAPGFQLKIKDEMYIKWEKPGYSKSAGETCQPVTFHAALLLFWKFVFLSSLFFCDI